MCTPPPSATSRLLGWRPEGRREEQEKEKELLELRSPGDRRSLQQASRIRALLQFRADLSSASTSSIKRKRKKKRKRKVPKSSPRSSRAVRTGKPGPWFDSGFMFMRHSWRFLELFQVSYVKVGLGS